MNFMDILGSLSPGVGMATGQGLGQYMPYMSPAFSAFKALSGGGGGREGQSPNALGQMSRLPDFMSGINDSLAANRAQGQRVSPAQQMGEMQPFRSGAGMGATSPMQMPQGGGGMEQFVQMLIDSIGRR